MGLDDESFSLLVCSRPFLCRLSGRKFDYPNPR